MTILNEGKDLYIRKGDTGNAIFKKLPKDKNYSVYLSIYDPDTFKIIKEMQGTFNQSEGVVAFSFGVNTTDNLPVGDWEYGLKLCADGAEDTILPRAYIDEAGELIRDVAPKFTVWEKVTEGVE